ncbi:diadenylate cyclase [Candidatus Woesearchaeota archaeon]|nr:diadenylate cyclase [Candidatus Woesearchaeota archaeon]
MEFITTVEGISKSVIEELAKDTNVDYIVTIKDESEDEGWIGLEEIDDSVVNKDDTSKGYEEQYIITIYREGKGTREHKVEKTKTVQMEGILSEVISDLTKHKFLKLNSKVLVVVDSSISKKYHTSILILDVDKVLYRIGRFDLAEKMSSETIIETIIELAQEIGREGREGKKVGTLFVIGDEDELKPYSKQLIMNPFKGYEKENLDVVNNQNLGETIKNFAQLDGAFIIDNEGHFLSAGTYLDVDTSDIKPFAGWGTKHLAATAITNITSSVAVLVSESGGAVKVFKNGKLILKLR